MKVCHGHDYVKIRTRWQIAVRNETPGGVPLWENKHHVDYFPIAACRDVHSNYCSYWLRVQCCVFSVFSLLACAECVVQSLMALCPT